MLRRPPSGWRQRNRKTTKRATWLPRLPLLPASEIPDRLEVNVEVIRRCAEGAADRPLVFRRHGLEPASHVRRQFAAASAAQRAADRLVEVASGTLCLLSQPRHLLPTDVVHQLFLRTARFCPMLLSGT